jgi:hypothetical protein
MLSTFFEHEVQSILALFLTNPELYKDYNKQTDRQGYFFAGFRKFADKYYNFSGDESIYFMSTRKQSAGEANICGGGGKMSGSASNFFKTRYYEAEKARLASIDAFAKKYGVSFEPGKDTRLFVGVTEIWNKLDKVDEILANSQWANVADRAYSDATFSTPLPAKLEKCLIPFAIRNKTLQKYKNSQRSIDVPISKKTEDDEEETPAPKPELKPELKIATPFVTLTDEELNDW